MNKVVIFFGTLAIAFGIGYGVGNHSAWNEMKECWNIPVHRASQPDGQMFICDLGDLPGQLKPSDLVK